MVMKTDAANMIDLEDGQRLVKLQPNQCDQMAQLIFQFLAIYDNESLLQLQNVCQSDEILPNLGSSNRTLITYLRIAGNY